MMEGMMMEGIQKWLETAYNFEGNSVRRGSLLTSWCTYAPVFASVRLQSISFFLANIFDYLAYLN